MSLVPKPGELVDPSAVTERCDRIDIWAAESDDVNALHGALAGLAAIDAYLDRVSIEGRERVAASMLRLKVRIGKLLGPGERGGDRGNQHTGGKSEGSDLPLSEVKHRDERHEFRKLAANEEIVERVIAESSDNRPATTQRALHEIRMANAPEPAPRDPEPRAKPDSYDEARRVFEALMQFNSACEHIDNLEEIIAAGMDDSVMPRLEVRGWVAQIPRARKHLDVLAGSATALRNLRSAK